MKVLKDRCVHHSGGDRSARNWRSDSTPDSDHPLVQAPVEGLQQGRRVVVPQSLPRLRTTLEVSFPVLGPRAEVVSDVAIQN